MSSRTSRKSIPAIKVQQWLKNWDCIRWNPGERRSEPQHWFYQFSMSASGLKALSGIYPRTTSRTRSSQDLGIQRKHEKGRSEEISKFVEFGYPWSNLSNTKRMSGEFLDLRQPGWLPTAVVVNILTSNDERKGKRVAHGDLVEVQDSDNDLSHILLPEKFNEDWHPDSLPPIEVIDGQHRLWAFNQLGLKDTYELPVVAFMGLDLSWQAYLFYTINIKPKKINPSLAFDLYPLLRTEEWLTKSEGHAIYRETRAQELVDLLWSYSASPWHHRINMLGERGHTGQMVTQAAWVRSLLASFVKSWEGKRGVGLGGLYGSAVGQHKTVLPWDLEEQAAFLIFMGETLQDAIAKNEEPWAKVLRKQPQAEIFTDNRDPAFFGTNNLLNQDQGVRILLQVVNDLCFVNADQLKLHEWGGDQNEEDDYKTRIDASIRSLRKKSKIVSHLKNLSESLASYDWRASSAPDLTDEQKTLKASFRGSGGYKELRRDVLRHVSKGKGDVAKAAVEVWKKLGYRV